MRSSRLIATAIALALILVPTAIAQSTGPDVYVAALPNLSNYGAIGGTDAISVGTTSCNQGDTPLLWQSSNPNHPVIGQNLYRVWEGRFDMIGRSWLKHGFTTVNNGICGTCSGPTGAQLYPGCSDPYSSGLNGSHNRLGPRFEVNATTGAFLYPYTDQGATGNDIYKRLQYSIADVDPANYPGARYFVEGHYVAPDDAAAGNQNNNASYREVVFTVTGADSSVSFASGSTTVQQVPAIGAWPLVDPNVAVQVVDIPNEGRLLVGFRATPQPSGLIRYVYAVHNLNSHRSVRLVNVAMPTGASVSNLTFNAPLWHSGEPYSNAAWPGAYVGNAVEWSTDTEAVDPNANAIRWGTTHTFSFDSNLAPTGTVSFGLYRAGSPAAVSASFAPPTPPPFVVSLPMGVPDTVLALQTTYVDVQATPVADGHDPASAMQHVSIDGQGFQSSPLNYLGSDLYRVTLPPAPCDSTIDWYVTIDSVSTMETVSLPEVAPIDFFRSTAVSDMLLFSDDFETDQGWTVANTNITGGGWERATPTSGGTRGDPVADSDGSGMCLLTQDLGPGNTNSDVDGGPTIVTSPAFDLSSAGDAQMAFQLWFVNDGNTIVDDTMEIEINDNAGSGWVQVEQLTSSTMGWEPRTLRVSDYCSLSSAVQIRFVVADSPNDSIVEAAVDAFSIFSCPLLIEEFAQGNVGANSGPPQQVLLVNGTNGGPTRHVIATAGSPLTFTIAQPSTHPVSANFAIFGRLGIPMPNEVYDVGLGVGQTCFYPCPADASNPLLFELFNNLVGTNCPTLLPSSLAPFTVGFGAGINFPLVFTLQGVVSDADNALTPGAAPFSITNAVIYETR